MQENSRSQQRKNRNTDLSEERNRSRQDNRQNASSGEANEYESPDGRERNDRFTTSAPDNYERDSE